MHNHIKIYILQNVGIHSIDNSSVASSKNAGLTVVALVAALYHYEMSQSSVPHIIQFSALCASFQHHYKSIIRLIPLQRL